MVHCHWYDRPRPFLVFLFLILFHAEPFPSMCNCIEASAFPFLLTRPLRHSPSSPPLIQAKRLPPSLPAVLAGRTPPPPWCPARPCIPWKKCASLFGYAVELPAGRLGLLQLWPRSICVLYSYRPWFWSGEHFFFQLLGLLPLNTWGHMLKQSSIREREIDALEK
jgi:hypothetical protein